MSRAKAAVSGQKRPPASPTSAPGAGPGRLVPFLAALLALAVHLPSLRTGFVYDDLATVVENQTLRHPGNWLALLLHMRFRPVVNVSYALDFALFGEAPWGYHLVNVLLHAVVAAAFGRLAERQWLRAGLGPRARWAAGVSALAFAVHPLLTQAVGYVSARSELLSALFLLLGLGAIDRALEPGAGRRWWAGGLGAFTLAAASKEPGAMMPFLALVLVELWPGEGGARWARARGPLLAFAGLTSLLGVARLAVLALYEPVPQSFARNLALQVQVLWRYGRLFVLPWGQSLVQPFQEVDASTAPLAVVAGLGLAGLLAGAWALRRRAPMVSLGLAWFFLCMAPSTLVPLAEPMSEHRVYAAALGLCLLAPAPLAWWPGAWAGSRPRAGVLAGAAVVLLTLGALSVARHRVWSSERALWAEAAERAPTVWAAQYGAASAMKAEGDCAAAVVPFRAAVQLAPAEVLAHHGLAECLARLGQPAEAFTMLRQAAEARPSNAATWANLGALALSEGAPRRALAYLQEAVLREPDNAARRARTEDLARWLAAHPEAPERAWPPGAR